MGKLTSKQMTQPRPVSKAQTPITQPQQNKPATKPAPSVSVPIGGELRVRRVDNGYLVSTQDKNWNSTGETVVNSLADINLKD